MPKRVITGDRGYPGSRKDHWREPQRCRRAAFVSDNLWYPSMGRIASRERHFGRDGIAGIAVPGFAGAMPAGGAQDPTRRAMLTVNRDFYDALWSAS